MFRFNLKRALNHRQTPNIVLFVTGRQRVPEVGQRLALTEQAPPTALQRQMGRQTLVPFIELQTSPGAQSAAFTQACPSVLVRVVSGQAQSTSSIVAGIMQTRLPGHPPRVAAAAAVGSQLNVQVWYAVTRVGFRHSTGP